jgi:hypothetical protein
VDFKLYQRWIGFGVKSGGQLGIGGFETTTAYVVNVQDGETFDLQIVSSRWGLGLGGGIGAVAVLGFGFSVPYELDHKSIDDWGINIALAERLFSKSVLHAIQGAKPFVDGFKNGLYVAPKLKQAKAAYDTWEALSKMRDLLHIVFGELEAGKGSGMGVVVIDLPLLGKGLELSAFLTRGKMYVSNPSHWIEPN